MKEEMNLRSIFFKLIKCVSGLAVKFDVAIVEPPVRLRANAVFSFFLEIEVRINISVFFL